MENLNFAHLLVEFEGPNRDLSDLFARLDVVCIQLELVEPGLWFDFSRSRRLLMHPAILKRFAECGYSGLNDLPSEAIASLVVAIEKHASESHGLKILREQSLLPARKPHSQEAI